MVCFEVEADSCATAGEAANVAPSEPATTATVRKRRDLGKFIVSAPGRGNG
jgi:hypothetical protein